IQCIEKKSNINWTNKDYFIGPILSKNNDKIAKEYLKNKFHQMQNIFNNNVNDEFKLEFDEIRKYLDEKDWSS
ncbi:MAG: tRNA (adenine(22)-N(1))-methyltransferase TrmK, partial [Ureaplasma sp.]|nr:tRNA (adenine(22)-N(1))-methyltransferase TrmK [Ureaplasma sp.]